MHWRTILVLLAALIALGGLLWWQRRSIPPAPPSPEAALVEGFEQARLWAIEVDHRMRGVQVRLELDDRQQWRIVDPLRGVAADPGLVAGLIEVAKSGRGVLQLESDAAGAEPAAAGAGNLRERALAKVGLAPPRARLVWIERAESGAEQRRVLDLGALDIDGRGVWVLAQGRLMHTTRALDALLDRGLDDYRERRALDIDPGTVTALRRDSAVSADPFTSPGAPFEAQADGIVGGIPVWRCERPRALALDPLGVTALLRAVCVLPVLSFVDDAPADLERYGLARPRFSITVELVAGTPRVLDFGRLPGGEALPVADGDWLCRERGSGPVWRVETREVALLAAALENLLDYRLLRVERAALTRVRITDLSGALEPLELRALERRWFLGEPGVAPRADAGRVEDLLGRLEGTELHAYLPELEAAALAPERRIELWAGDECVSRFELGAPHAARDARGRLVLRDGDAVPALAEEALHALTDPRAGPWRSREVWKFSELELASFEVAARGRQRRYVRDPADGRWLRDGQRDYQANELEPLWLERLFSVQAAAWLDPGPVAELGEPAVATLTDKVGREHRLRIGRAADGTIELEYAGARARPRFPDLHAALLRWIDAP